MSLRSQYVIGLYRDINPTKSRCRPNIACPLGRERAFKWKMSFNLDPTKPAQEKVFSRKLKTVLHPSITFNNNPLITSL